jgi:hypothetical protein
LSSTILRLVEIPLLIAAILLLAALGLLLVLPGLTVALLGLLAALPHLLALRRLVFGQAVRQVALLAGASLLIALLLLGERGADCQGNGRQASDAACPSNGFGTLRHPPVSFHAWRVVGPPTR